jgi:putative oxidoreductase
MNIHGKISGWDDKYPFLFVILRVILGFILAIRGIFFLTSIQPLFHLIKSSSLSELNMNMTLALVICWVHLLGGTFIILGLLTRISAWAQIPILIGAILFINLNGGLSQSFSELILSVFVLILSALFAIAGGGRISMDKYAKTHLL